MRTQGKKNMDIRKNKRKLEVGVILRILGVKSGAFITKAASGSCFSCSPNQEAGASPFCDRVFMRESNIRSPGQAVFSDLNTGEKAYLWGSYKEKPVSKP